MNKNAILFSETQKFIVPETDNPVTSDRNKILAVSASRNLQDYGYTLSSNFIEKLAALPEDQIVSTYKDIVAVVKDTVGAQTASAAVFYPNFPDEVMSMSDFELYLNAFAYYVGEALFDVDVHVSEEPKERTPLIEVFERECKVINPATEKDFEGLMRDRMFSAKVLPMDKLNDLVSYMKESDAWKKNLENKQIPNKENMSVVCSAIYRDKSMTHDDKMDRLHTILNTSIDVLRFAGMISNDHGKHNTPDLKGRVDFKFTKPEGRDIKDLLSSQKNLFVDVWREKDLFKKLGRSVSMEKSTPPRLKLAYDNLCSNKKLDERGDRIESPEARINRAVESVKNHDFTEARKCAHDFPGLFSRNFVRMLDAAPSDKNKADLGKIYLEECSGKVAPMEALKLANYIEKMPDMEYRIVHTPSNGKWVKLDAVNPVVNNDVRKEISSMLRDTAANYFAGSENPGTVYIDNSLENNKLPGNDIKESSKGSVLTPGSVIPAKDEANIKRAFIWWTNGEEDRPDHYYNHIDIDLSVSFYDKDGKEVGVCSYYDLKAADENGVYAVHSGDFTNGGPVDGPGVSEFVDVDINALKERGIEYFSMDVHSYSDDNFSTLPNVKFGFMEREGSLDDTSRPGQRSVNVDIDSFNGEIYDPKTVETCIDLNSDSVSTVPVIYSVKDECFIWIDKNIRIDRGLVNAANPKFVSEGKAILYKYTNDFTPSMKELFEAYAKGSGATLTSDIKDADKIFVSKPFDEKEAGVKEGAQVVTAYDLSKITSDYMVKSDKKPADKVEAGSVDKNEDKTDAVDKDQDDSDSVEAEDYFMDSDPIE